MFDEFQDGITVLQKGFESNYKKETLDFIFERVKGRTAFDWLRVCEMLLTQADRLPAAWKILQTFPPTIEKQENNSEPSQAYWDILNARHAEAEQIVGDSFENFIRHCGGNKKLASLYFGRAYWNAKGVGKYDENYDAMITDFESGGEGDFAFSQKPRTSEEVFEGLKSFYRKNGFIANRWYWKRFWPNEVLKVESENRQAEEGR